MEQKLLSCKYCGVVVDFNRIIERNDRILSYLDELRSYKEIIGDTFYFKCPVCSKMSVYKEGEK